MYPYFCYALGKSFLFGGESHGSLPRALRIHIAILSKRNVGKSSLINAITDQEIAIVSEVREALQRIQCLEVYGNTAHRTLLAIIDTAGIDDEGD